ncbi:Abhydrolase domain-containing protein 14A, partial [Stegodyphus mimosarum]
MVFGQRTVFVTVVILMLWMGFGIVVYKAFVPEIKTSSQSKSFVNPSSPEEEVEACKSSGQKLSPDFWRKINLHKKSIPQSLISASSLIVVQSDHLIIQDAKVHYKYAKPQQKQTRNLSVLLLHGQAYTSETWNRLGTLKSLAGFGYYAVAVDLPGFGHTEAISNLDRTDFLDKLIAMLKLENVVIVSPSMSGSLSLRYLIQYPENLTGFIPVSPVGTRILNENVCKDENDRTLRRDFNEDCERIMHYLKSGHPNLNCLKVPTLIVFGERDRGENSAKLCLLPNGQGA